MSKWIRKNDKVVVLAGNERGRTATVLSRRGDKVLLQGLNIRKRHARRKSKNAPSEILEKEMPLAISNVALCNEEGSPIKLKVRWNSKGEKELYYLEGSKEIVHRLAKEKI